MHENPAIAVRRELKEETGLDILPVRIIGAYENKQGVRSINIVYECNATVGELICNYEGKCEWLPEDIFAEKLISIARRHCATTKKTNMPPTPCKIFARFPAGMEQFHR